jgi:hypothetical protein
MTRAVRDIFAVPGSRMAANHLASREQEQGGFVEQDNPHRQRSSAYADEYAIEEEAN